MINLLAILLEENPFTLIQRIPTQLLYTPRINSTLLVHNYSDGIIVKKMAGRRGTKCGLIKLS